MIQYIYHKLASIIDEGLVREMIVKLLVFDFYNEMHADMIDTTIIISESVLLFLLHKSDRMGCNLVEAESVSAVGEGKVPFVLKVLENAAYINIFNRILVDGNLA